MAHDIRIPRLGWSMEEGTFVRWLKRPGERVMQGEPLFELEGEKSVEPVESIDAGCLHLPAGSPADGTVVKVGVLIGWLLADGESPPPLAPETLVPAATPAAQIALPSAPVPAVPVFRAPLAPQAPLAPLAPQAPLATGPVGGPTSPAIRRLARELGVALESLTGSGPAGRIMAENVYAAAVARGAAPTVGLAGGRQRSSPRARATATRQGIDWRSLAGSGRGGRIREVDVLAAGQRGQAGAPAALPPRLAGLPKRRRSIALRMLESLRENAPVTLHTRADVTNLVALRNRIKAAGTLPLPAYTDLLAKLVADVLGRHRLLAGCWDEAGTLVFPEADGLHIGIAVDTAAGLLAPVVRNVGQKTLAEVTNSSRELIEKARTEKLPAADMQGGVFTITNLGSFRIEEFTPIINAPQTAILGVGAILREAVVVGTADNGESIAIRDRMTLSLSFDHCRVDGGPAARFLDDLRRIIEAPEAALE